MENFKKLRKKISKLENDINTYLQDRVSVFYKETGLVPSNITVYMLDVTDVKSLLKDPFPIEVTVEINIKPIR